MKGALFINSSCKRQYQPPNKVIKKINVMESKKRGSSPVVMYHSLFIKYSHLRRPLYLLDTLCPGKIKTFICSLLKTPSIHNDLYCFEVKL